MFVPEPPVQVNPDPTTEPTVCAVHPNIETTLRCNKCGRYMCSRCAVRTPVGYRCRQCVYQQQDAYFTATNVDSLIAIAVSFGLGLPLGYLVPRIFLLITLLLSFPAGTLIAEAVRRATGRRRGRNTWIIVACGIVAAAIVANFGLLLPLLASEGSREAVGLGIDLWTLVMLAIYIVLCVAGAIARLRYGK